MLGYEPDTHVMTRKCCNMMGQVEFWLYHAKHLHFTYILLV